MSFLTPWLLIGLPLAGLPILIHLINQRRFQTVEWGAIRFLLEANRMSRGYARIRRWLILLFRVLAVAALVFAVSRPLASGWLGLAGGGKAETTIIIVDRSASMGQLGAGSAASKLTTGLAKLTSDLKLFGSSRWIVVDSVNQSPREITSPDALETIVPSSAASATSDLAGLLETARNYIAENRTGQTEIWILSDLRANDWNATSGRWRAIRDGFLEFKQGIRFRNLQYDEIAEDNLAIEVTEVKQRGSGVDASLLVSLRLSRATSNATETVPVRFEIDGAGSELPVELIADAVELVDHEIKLPPGTDRGWGRVTIPADSNPADNASYFVFAESLPRRIALVTGDAPKLNALQIAAAISPTPSQENMVEVLTPGQLASLVWEEVALVVWHAPLPTDNAATMIESFLDRGGQVICVPPATPNDTELAGVSWGGWKSPADSMAVTTWRGDADLLARSQSGTALPVGELAISRYCTIGGEHTPLATLGTGETLMARAIRENGALYFLGTTSASADSTLAADGVVLYVALQRAIANGGATLGTARQIIAGLAGELANAPWQVVETDDDVLSNEYAHHAGVYSVGDRLLAVNVAQNEPHADVLTEEQVKGLFAGLDFEQVSDQAGNLDALTREIWRVFLTGMIVALIVEAALCVPKPQTTEVQT